MAKDEVKETETKDEKPVIETGTPKTDAPAEIIDDNKPKPKAKKKKGKRNIASGQLHILATFNNTIVTVTDEKGNVVAASSAGANGFRGSKKGTAYAAQVAAEKVLAEAKTLGMSRVEVFVKGIGLGREAAIRTLSNQKIAIESIKDETGIPHGGVRPRKAKRN
jgi:small subunit ribosomal protein S11